MAHAFKGEMFEKFPVQTIGKNTFTLDTQNIFTTDWGRVTPIFCQENLSGEIWKMGVAMFVRMHPLATPIMHQVDCFVHAFHVRNPIIWTKWKDFIRGGDDGNTDIAPPNVGNSVDSETYARFFVRYLTNLAPTGELEDEKNLLCCESSLMDYLGLPTISKTVWTEYVQRKIDKADGLAFDSVVSDMSTPNKLQPFSLLPFKAYQAIFNEYYRDEYIQDEIPILEDLGGDHLGAVTADIGGAQVNVTPQRNDVKELFKLRYRAWEKDPFTSALQKPVAIPDVKIPMSADVNIFGTNGEEIPFRLSGEPADGDLLFYGLRHDVGSADESVWGIEVGPGYNESGIIRGTSDVSQRSVLALTSSSIANHLRGEIASVSATINQLRTNVAMQEWLELSARAGNRYKEMLIAHFNTVVPDYTLDRPQYLGGTRFTIGISQVLQQSATTGTAGSDDFQPLGQLAGQGMAGSGDFLFREKFYEHGHVILLMSIRPRSMYTSMLPKMFQRFDRREYYWNKLANIGDQEIKNKEVNFRLMGLTEDVNYVTTNNPEGTFGYQSRYWEYKYFPNTVHGDFKTNMRDWHLGRFFNTVPNLNPDFIEVKGAQLNRAFAYTGDDYDHFLCQANIDCKVVRPIPIFSIPKFT